MRIFYAGDLHGRVDDVAQLYRWCKKERVNYVVQVGDFGIRWGGVPCKLTAFFAKQARKPNAIPWYTCGGNHDNWVKWRQLGHEQEQRRVQLAPLVHLIERGQLQYLAAGPHVVPHAFCGGADSTDRHVRTEGVDWWSEELPTYAELLGMFDQMEQAHGTDTVVTHDCPTRVPLKRNRDKPTLPRAFDTMLTQLAPEQRPQHWVFGHHHELFKWSDPDSGIAFYCCGLHGQGWLRDTTDNTWTMKE